MTTKQPLNQILYGPPGTGKTYNTIYKALDILGVKTPDEKEWFNNPDADKYRKEALDSFRENKDRIVMTTFHQSMSYEDFIEGIKPEIPKDSDGNYKEVVLYKNKSGILKDLVEECNESIEVFKQQYGSGDIVGRFYSFAEKEEITFTKSRGKQFTINGGKIDASTTDREFGNLKDILQSLISKIDFQKNYQPSDIIKLLIKTDVKSGSGNSDQRASYIAPIVNEIKSFRNSLKEEKYVLIIDEINRGNVANIFGELITLIEDDKRTTKWDEDNKTYVENPEGVKVKLPYSGQEFGVPGNLYIIGTMNTADRSVEALDSALRRRFSFTEMMPKPKLLKEVKINEVHISNGTDQASLADLLYTINKRIEILKDREHQIGHSYFMKFVNDKKYENGVDAEELREVFYNKIIPLLQEYFYGDYESILKVLSSDFIIKEETKDDNNKTVDFFGNISNEVGIDKPMDLPYTINIIENGKFADAINSLKLVKWTE